MVMTWPGNNVGLTGGIVAEVSIRDRPAAYCFSKESPPHHPACQVVTSAGAEGGSA